MYFDLQKAFDTVDHEILLTKLYTYKYGIHDWFRDYLTNGKQLLVALLILAIGKITLTN